MTVVFAASAITAITEPQTPAKIFNTEVILIIWRSFLCSKSTDKKLAKYVKLEMKNNNNAVFSAIINFPPHICQIENIIVII